MTKVKTDLFCLCDFALTSQDGKLSVIGIFDRIFAVNLPTRYSRFFLVALLSGEPEREVQITLSALAPGGKAVLPKRELKLKLGNNGKANIITDLANFPINETGEYQFRLLLDKEEIGKTVLTVVKVKADQTKIAAGMPN